jgi:hypothetical protein
MALSGAGCGGIKAGRGLLPAKAEAAIVNCRIKEYNEDFIAVFSYNC